MAGWNLILTDLQTAAAEAQPEDIPDLLAKLERATATAYARLLITQPALAAPEDDCLLTADEVAGLLNVKRKWVYDHKMSLGVVRLSSRKLRFKREAVLRYMRQKGGHHGER